MAVIYWDIQNMQKSLIRTLDLILSLTGIFFGLPIMLVIYFISLYLNGSPLFFQQRVGKDQKLFTLIKFRTMAHRTASVGTHLVDSNSVTRLGGFLRKTKLDELPQLFNVLVGQMSLVGPRPCLSNQLDLINERAERGVFRVRPGITGLAQVNEIDMSTPRKLAQYDRLMIDTMTVRLYLKLILATALGGGSGDRTRNIPTK
jgi:lipopolysaccharide/colanic/teichoic acid biosynthesis glycosyltransferase